VKFKLYKTAKRLPKYLFYLAPIFLSEYIPHTNKTPSEEPTAPPGVRYPQVGILCCIVSTDMVYHWQRHERKRSWCRCSVKTLVNIYFRTYVCSGKICCIGLYFTQNHTLLTKSIALTVVEGNSSRPISHVSME
jgi:hypothetical protein